MTAHSLLPDQPTPPSLIEIAIEALAGEGVYGVVTDLAQAHALQRRQVYGLREKARAAVAQAFKAKETPAARLTLPVNEADIARTAIGLRTVAPASVRDIVAMLPIIYGKAGAWSYGKVEGVLAEAQARAAALMSAVDLSGVENVALDEMFSQGRPVFGGIDLDTQYLVLLKKHPSRGGEDWDACLAELRDKQGLQPRRVVKDAGTGLATGVTQCWPGAQQNDDIFHALYLMGRESYHLERRAYKAIGEEYEAEERRWRAHAGQARAVGQACRHAREHAAHAIERCDRFEAVQRTVKQALELSDLGGGRLHTRAEVVAVLCAAADELDALGGGRIAKVARYLRNRAQGLGFYLDDLRQRLDAVTTAAGGEVMVEAVVRAYQANLRVGGRSLRYWEKRVYAQELETAAEHLMATAGHDRGCVVHALNTVLPVLVQRYRASSAIENLNSVLRPYLVVHKNVEQGFLNLFQFYWNTRLREWGRGKGSSAYEQLTGRRVDDWLTMLGYPPSEAFAAAA
jgi:hypothetical protein